MKKLKFDVYIGEKLLDGQSEKIKAVVVPRFFIPIGKYNLDGTDVISSFPCFVNLHDLGTYFGDWIDFCEEEERLHATIHLNSLSNKKTFQGRAIINLIDSLNNNVDYRHLRSFEKCK